MTTGTNGIATEGEAKSKLSYGGSVDTNKCCTKAKAVTMGADSTKLGNYSDSQLVKYSDIIKLKPINYLRPTEPDGSKYFTVISDYNVNSRLTLSVAVQFYPVGIYRGTVYIEKDEKESNLFVFTNNIPAGTDRWTHILSNISPTSDDIYEYKIGY